MSAATSGTFITHFPAYRCAHAGYALHLFQHQVHHRGQAHCMLSGTSVSPLQLDEFFAVGEASLRAKEFAELGWSEEKIWGGSGDLR